MNLKKSIVIQEKVHLNSDLRLATHIQSVSLQGPGLPSFCVVFSRLQIILISLFVVFLCDIQAAGAAPANKSAAAKQSAVAGQDLWQRLRKRFSLPGKGHKRSRSAARWYTNNPEYLQRVTIRAQPFLYLITEAVEKRKMPAEIALLPIVESAFRPYAYSPGKASGVWQFIPATGRRFKLKQNWWYDGHRDIVQSSRAALDYLQHLHRKFNRDWLLALAAYNCGEGRVAKAISANKRAGRGTGFWSLKLPRETRGYVPQLLGLAKVISHPKKHGIKLDSIANRPVVASVNTGGQIDLSLAAKLARVDLDTIYKLNPAFNHWGSSPNGPHQILLPVKSKKKFQSKLAKIPKSKRIKMRRHRVSKGDTLSGIAKLYGSSTRAIKDVNHIASRQLLVVDREILIPVPKQSEAIYIASRKKSKQVIPDNIHSDGDAPIYVVQPGDSFWKIGKEFRISHRQLSVWNNIALNERLKPGQKLVLSPSAKYSNAESRSSARRKVLYKVRSGDSLWLISRKFNVAVKEIRTWNNLKKTRYLRPGQKLIIYDS